MENKDFQSFETVDLFSPVELTPIQGIESPFKAPEKAEEPKKAPENGEDIPQKEAPADDGMFNPFQDDAWRHYKYNNETAGDPRRFFREEEDLRRKLREKDRRRNQLLAIGIIFSLLMMVIIHVIRFYISNSRNQTDDRVIGYPADKDVIVLNDYLGQDDVYGTLSLDAESVPSSDLVKINPDVIEYTGMYYRSLYFTVTPKVDNVVTEITVEMIDRYGNSFGKCINVMDEIPAGKESIVEISFGINPNDDLNGVSYELDFNIFQVEEELSKKNITGITGQDELVWAKIEGDETVSKYAYAVFYKDGKVVSVQCEYAHDTLEGLVLFETGKIDFDYFKIFY